MTTIDNSHFKLRPLTETDIDKRYVSWHTNADGHLDYYTASGRSFPEEFLREQLKNAASENKYFYAIVDVNTDEVIGNVRIGPIHTHHGISDLVILIGDRSYLGRGLAPVIIAMANKIAFEEHGISKLAGGMIESNIPSIKGYVRGGWLIEGILRAHHNINGKRQDFITVGCFNPAEYGTEFMRRAQKNHEFWYEQIFPNSK